MASNKVINLLEAPADYNDAATVILSDAVGYRLVVANQPVYLERQLVPEGGWEPEEFYVPGLYLEGLASAGLRFRSAVSSSPAIVSVRLMDSEEWRGGGSVAPFTQTITLAGAVASTFPLYTLTQWPPSPPATLAYAVLADTYDGVAFAWLLQYRPDLDATYPWQAAAGQYLVKGMDDADATSSAGVAPTWADVTVGGSSAKTAFTAPRGGVYEIGGRLYHESGGTRDMGFAIGSGSPATFDTTAADDRARVHSAQVTANSGDQIKLKTRSSSAPAGHRAVSVWIRPVKIA